MSRAMIVLNSKFQRQRAVDWCWSLKDGTRCEFKAPKRSDDQNAKMWAMLSEVATQTKHHGIKLTPDDWKLLFLDALKREVRMVPNLDGNGIVSLGRSSSDLSKEEMSDLIELIFKFGAEHGIQFHDPHEPQSATPPADAGVSHAPNGTSDTPALIPDDESGQMEAGEQFTDQKVADGPLPGSPASEPSRRSECVAKLLELATRQDLTKEQRAEELAEGADLWTGALEPSDVGFVKEVWQTCRKVLKGELTTDRARQFLDGIAGAR